MSKRNKYRQKFLRLTDLILQRHEQSDFSNQILYHYTTHSAFENIIRSNELHLSSLNRLNDAGEFNFGREYVVKFLEKYQRRNRNVRRFIDEFNTFFRDRQLFLASFCPNSNSNHLWKRYGDNFRGIALGINQTRRTVEQFDFIEDWPPILMKVRYGFQPLRDDLELYICTFSKLMKYVTDIREYGEIAAQFAQTVILCLPRHKSKQWINEKEYRWCIMDRMEIPTRPLPENLFVNERVRVRNIIDDLAEIRIGPNSSVNEDTVRSLINNNNISIHKIGNSDDS